MLTDVSDDDDDDDDDIITCQSLVITGGECVEN